MFPERNFVQGHCVVYLWFDWPSPSHCVGCEGGSQTIEPNLVMRFGYEILPSIFVFFNENNRSL